MLFRTILKVIIMETTVKQRLVDFIEFMGMNKNSFETTCGLSKRYVSNIGNSIHPEQRKKISLAFPQLNMGWLLANEGEMLKEVATTTISGDINISGGNNSNIGHGNTYINANENNVDDTTSYMEVEKVERAPILSATLARAPQVDVLEAVKEKADELEKAPVGVFNAPISMWYRVQDESLAPKYEIGDMLALWAYPKGEEDPIPGKMYGINTSTNGLIVRRLFPQVDGGYIAKAANRDEYPDYHIKAANIVQIYKIMLMVRF